jgi:signal transduction histidine kinase
MQQQKRLQSRDTGNVSLWILLQLLLSFVLTGALTLCLWTVLRPQNLPTALVILLTLLASSLLGLLLTTNIHYALYLLDLALSRLAPPSTRLPAEARDTIWLWPFGTFFWSIRAISQHMDSARLREQSEQASREQLLRRASEEAAEQERNRIARELHDSIKQQLFSIRMSAAAASAQTDNAQGQEAITDIQKSAEEAQVEMQALLQQLRSAALENTSLSEAIRVQAQALGYRTGAQIFVEIGDLPSADFCPPSMQEGVFRIAQEAFANIARHARAHTVWFTLLQQQNTLQMIIRDDGQGFDVQHQHRGMGVANIQERALAFNGYTNIESSPGQGTTVHVTIPLLLSQETKLEQAQRNHTARQLILRAQNLLQLRATLSTLAILVMVVSLVYDGVSAVNSVRSFSLLILVASTAVMVYCLVATHFAVARLSIHFDLTTHELTSLRLQQHRALASFWNVLIFIFWYILLFYPNWHERGVHRLGTLNSNLLALSVVLPACVFIISLLQRPPLIRIQNQYYSQLSTLELSWEVQQRERRIRLALFVCLLCCLAGPILVLINQLIFFPPLTSADVWNYFIILVLVVTCIRLVEEIFTLRRWKKYALSSANTGREVF